MNWKGISTALTVLIITAVLAISYLVLFENNFSLKVVINNILQSETFSLKTGSCVPTFEVKKGENITPSEIYARRCYETLSKQECESIDLYSSEKDSFLQKDGTPDCEWKF